MQFVVVVADGSMEDLDGKWILAKDTACPEKDASPATLGLPNMAGLQSAHTHTRTHSRFTNLVLS